MSTDQQSGEDISYLKKLGVKESAGIDISYGTFRFS